MSISFGPQYYPSTRQLAEAFRDEVSLLGASVIDVFVNDRLVIGRAVLPEQADVRPRDAINAGVAIRALGPEVVVHPYTMRQVCTNGAVAPRTITSVRIEGVEAFESTYEVSLTLDKVAEAIRACAAPEMFEQTMQAMRETTDVEGDLALQVLPYLSQSPDELKQVLPFIVMRFAGSGDPSAFGLMNAVTSVARDTHDPEMRWSLEELGGAIPARLHRAPSSAPAAGGVVTTEAR